MIFPPPAPAPPAIDISDDGDASARLSSAPFGTQLQPAGVATPRDLHGLSHAEKLQRMREIRQASMGMQPGTPRASTALA